VAVHNRTPEELSMVAASRGGTAPAAAKEIRTVAIDPKRALCAAELDKIIGREAIRLGDMMAKSLTCFIIGPMADVEGVGSRARLTRLKDQVIRPVLERITSGTDESYRILTPFDLGLEGGSAIVRDVIYNIDRADIVVADLTNGNPNVFYELGITHALGRPCVAVLQEGQPIQFDINAYRVFRVDLRTNDYEADEIAYVRARDALYPALRAAHLATDDWSRLENPVIDYYHAPMTYVSPAPALAEGYFLNFVRPVVEALTQSLGDRYIYDIGLADIGSNAPNQMDEVRPLSGDRRARLDLQIIVPARIDLAKHDYADLLRSRAYPALVETRGRTMTLWAHETSDGVPHLIDIPTTMRGVEHAVDRRMRYSGMDHDTDEWRLVENQEINRFMLMLGTSIKTKFDSTLSRRKVRVLRSDQLAGEDNLAWLEAILPTD
jgi:hypothetical protein